MTGRSLLVVLGGLAMVACTRESPSTVPEPPDVAAPAPARAALSRFSVPLEYDFTPVMAIVERVVPRTFGSMDSVRQKGDDDRRHYAFEAARGPFTAFADANHLHLRTTLTYAARGYIKPRIGPTISAGCGKGSERPRLVVELATPLTLTEGWHLASRAHVVKVEPYSKEQRDHCDVSFLRKDVTDRVVEAARSALESQLPRIDRQVASVDLTGHATEWWGLLAKPIRLTDGVWLLLGPEQLRAGRVSGASKVLTVPVTLDARPRIVTSPTEPAAEPTALPSLGADSTADGFKIVMDGVIDYGTASKELTSAFSEKTFTQAGHSVSVLQVSVRPLAKGRLSLLVVFAGDVNGKLELEGTPSIDHVKNVITVPDLEFDLKSDNRLLETYTWLKVGRVARRDPASLEDSDAPRARPRAHAPARGSQPNDRRRGDVDRERRFAQRAQRVRHPRRDHRARRGYGACWDVGEAALEHLAVILSARLGENASGRIRREAFNLPPSCLRT